jgi:hemoglobin
MLTNHVQNTRNNFRALLRFWQLILAGALVCIPAHAAQDAPDGLYEAFGKQAGIVQLTDDFVNRLTKDSRISAMFKDSNIRRVKEKIAEQLCVVTGGPCTYTGDSMAEVHGRMGVKMKDFNALVEDLQDAMGARQIAFADQNRLLALLAPMYRDMVKP